MPHVTYIEPDGTQHRVDVPEGESVMKGAANNGIPGIPAECGGACACATCHVYVDPQWNDRLDPMSDIEEAMLEFAEHKQPTSRLSCQIITHTTLNGLIVRIPPYQS